MFGENTEIGTNQPGKNRFFHDFRSRYTVDEEECVFREL